MTRLKRWLRSWVSPIVTVEPVPGLFPALDIEALRRREDPAGHGRRDGMRNVQPPAARTPGPFEHDVTRMTAQ
jgi:hypothetical protein